MPNTRKNRMRKSMKKQQQKRQQQKRQQQKKQQRKSMKKGGARRRRTQRKVMKGGKYLEVNEGDYVQNIQATSIEVYVVDKVKTSSYDIKQVVVEKNGNVAVENGEPVLKKDAGGNVNEKNILKEQEDLKYEKYAEPVTPGATAAATANAGAAKEKYVKVTYDKDSKTYTAEPGECTNFKKQ